MYEYYARYVDSRSFWETCCLPENEGNRFLPNANACLPLVTDQKTEVLIFGTTGQQIPFFISSLAAIWPRCYGNNSGIMLKNAAIPLTGFNTVRLLSLTLWILSASCISLGVLQQNLMQQRYFRSNDTGSVSLLHNFAISLLCEASYGIWQSSVTFARMVWIVSHLHNCAIRRMEFNAKAWLSLRRYGFC